MEPLRAYVVAGPLHLVGKKVFGSRTDAHTLRPILSTVEESSASLRYPGTPSILDCDSRATIFRNRTTQALGALACMILLFLTLPAQTAGTSGPPSETPFWLLLLEPQVIASGWLVGLILVVSAPLTPSP